nr:hypothetical protein [Okeania hirsuta]
MSISPANSPVGSGKGSPLHERLWKILPSFWQMSLTGNLDSVMGNEVMDILIKLNEEDETTIVMVTHDEKYGNAHAPFGTLI